MHAHEMSMDTKRSSLIKQRSTVEFNYIYYIVYLVLLLFSSKFWKIVKLNVLKFFKLIYFIFKELYWAVPLLQKQYIVIIYNFS